MGVKKKKISPLGFGGGGPTKGLGVNKKEKKRPKFFFLKNGVQFFFIPMGGTFLASGPLKCFFLGASYINGVPWRGI